jgi:transcriptional regulator with XRE-family HTH domain
MPRTKESAPEIRHRDTEIGHRIRAQRLICRMSQTELANALGVTFQQVQKYEKGVSRVGAGRLARIADTLEVPISFFESTPRPRPRKRSVKRGRGEEHVITVPGGELRVAVTLNPAANAFLKRSMAALLRIARTDREDKLNEAMTAPTDVGAVARALSNSEVIGAGVTELDPLAPLIARGVEDKQNLIREAGGLLSASEVAKARGITPQAVYKQRRARKLLSVTHGGEEKFPAVQFTKDGEPIPGLPVVLQTVGLAGPWGTLDFLLTPDDELDGLSPVEALKKYPEKLEQVVRLARVQGEHGAG